MSAVVTDNAPDDVVITRCHFENNLQAIDVNGGARTGTSWTTSSSATPHPRARASAARAWS